jgi:hypothetical protein
MQNVPKHEACDDTNMGFGVIACVWAPLYLVAVISSISVTGPTVRSRHLAFSRGLLAERHLAVDISSVSKWRRCGLPKRVTAARC